MPETVASREQAQISTIAVTGPWTIDSLQLHLSQRIEQAVASSGLSFHHVEEMVSTLQQLMERTFEGQRREREGILVERDHRYQDRFEASDLRYQQRFDAQQEALKVALSGVETTLLARLNAVREETAAALTAVAKADIAHGDLLKEIDLRYQQRFDAQEHAVQVALSHVDKEFHEHLVAVREETQAALSAADKAISKSEVASEKRFEAVNEFRGQLGDQAARLMPRAEAEQRISNNTEKIDNLEKRLTDSTAQINSRLDVNQGQQGGSAKVQAGIFAAIAALVGVGGIIIAIANST